MFDRVVVGGGGRRLVDSRYRQHGQCGKQYGFGQTNSYSPVAGYRQHGQCGKQYNRDDPGGRIIAYARGGG